MATQLLEKSIKSFTYTPPTDPELLLYDFYFLIGYLPTKEEDPELRFVFSEALETCTTHLQKHMTQAVKFSLGAELRHIFSKTVDLQEFVSDSVNYRKKPISDDEESTDNYLSSRAIKFLIEYQKQAQGVGPDSLDYAVQKQFIRAEMDARPTVQTVAGDVSGNGRHDTYKKYYYVLLQTQKHFKLSNVELGKILIELYNKPDWHGGYGGIAWARIADAWVHLLQADTIQSRMIWIDHVYDIQHNTGSVFTKVKAYMKDSSFEWLGSALSWKRDNTDIRNFYSRVSPSLKYVVAYVGKKYYNVSIYAEPKKVSPRVLAKYTKQFAIQTLDQLREFVEQRDYMSGWVSKNNICLGDLVSVRIDFDTSFIGVVTALPVGTDNNVMYARFDETGVSQRRYWAESKDITLLKRLPIFTDKDIFSIDGAYVSLMVEEVFIVLQSDRELQLLQLVTNKKLENRRSSPRYPAYARIGISELYIHASLPWVYSSISFEEFLKRENETRESLPIGTKVIIPQGATPDISQPVLGTITGITQDKYTVAEVSDSIPKSLCKELSSTDKATIAAFEARTLDPKEIAKDYQWEMSRDQLQFEGLEALSLVLLNTRVGIILAFSPRLWVAVLEQSPDSSSGGVLRYSVRTLFTEFFPGDGDWEGYGYPRSTPVTVLQPSPASGLFSTDNTLQRSTTSSIDTYFVVGEYYKWVGPKRRPRGWHSSGLMDFMLSGKPYKCLAVDPANPAKAKFNDSGMWYWGTDSIIKYMKHVPAESDTSEVIEFIPGHWYKWTGPGKGFPEYKKWNPEGKMDFVLDGRPHKVLSAVNNRSVVPKIEFDGHPAWWWYGAKYFKEVDPPNRQTESIFKKFILEGQGK